MTRLSDEEIRYLEYQIYSFKYGNPWIPNKQIAKLVNRSISTVDRYAKIAEEETIVPTPQLRLNFPFRKVALLLFEDKWRAYNELQEYSGITYLSAYQGDWDITAMYDGFVDFSQVTGYKGKVMEESVGKIFTQKVKYTSWEPCFATMETLLEKSDIEESTIKCSSSYPDWNDDHWKMFNYFKLNVRRKFSHLRKEHPISWRCFEEWKQDLVDYCAIITYYFPEGYQTYDSFTLCFKTDYDKYIVTLFSTFPTSSVFYKMGRYFLVDIFVPSDYELQMRIYNIVSQLLNKGIITDCIDGSRIMYWHCERERPVTDDNLAYNEYNSSRFVAGRIYSSSLANYIDLKSITEKLKFRKLTGLLKVTHDVCNGVIIFDEGTIIDGYEIFNDELLVRDEDGSYMLERCRTKPGKIDVYNVQRETLHILLKTLREGSTEEFPASFRLFL
jgi:hypothetical protein